MGKLIVIEGLDGSGKATQSEILLERLKSEGQNALKVSFPNYDEDTSAPIKMYLAGELGELSEINTYGASLLYTVDRYGSYLRHWKKPYDEGATVICDRYTTSNAVHQMSKLPREEWDSYLDWLWETEFEKVTLPAPDLTIYLDMPAEVSKKLLAKRYHNDETKKDLHEKNFQYMKHCRDAACYAAEHLNWVVIPCSDGENPYSIEKISEDIYNAVKEHL